MLHKVLGGKKSMWTALCSLDNFQRQIITKDKLNPVFSVRKTSQIRVLGLN